MNRSFGEHPLIASSIGYLNIDILSSLDYAQDIEKLFESTKI
jgi:hypothetical protein